MVYGDSDEERLDFLYALECAGVDNWEWYGEAVNIYNGLRGITDDDEPTPVAVEEPVEPEVTLDAAQTILLDAVGQERFDVLDRVIWKRSYKPEYFERATQSGGTAQSIRVKYVQLLLDSGYLYRNEE